MLINKQTGEPNPIGDHALSAVIKTLVLGHAPTVTIDASTLIPVEVAVEAAVLVSYMVANTLSPYVHVYPFS